MPNIPNSKLIGGKNGRGFFVSLISPIFASERGNKISIEFTHTITTL